MDYALQIANEGIISDFQAPNVYWDQVNAMITDTWEDYETAFKGIYQEKMQLLAHLLKPVPIPSNLLKTTSFQLLTQAYIRHFGLEALTKVLNEQNSFIHILRLNSFLLGTFYLHSKAL